MEEEINNFTLVNEEKVGYATSESSMNEEEINFHLEENMNLEEGGIPRTKNEIVKTDVEFNFQTIEERRVLMGVGSNVNDGLIEFGKILDIVQKKVLVESIPNSPILNLDSVLWLEMNEPLGKVDDVIGSVSKPYYVILLDKYLEELLNKGNLMKEQKICYKQATVKVLHEKEITEKMRAKGTDASNRYDEEITQNDELEFSDDEKESMAKSKKKGLKRKFKPAEKEQEPMMTSFFNIYLDPIVRTGFPAFNPKPFFIANLPTSNFMALPINFVVNNNQINTPKENN